MSISGEISAKITKSHYETLDFFSNLRMFSLNSRYCSLNSRISLLNSGFRKFCRACWKSICPNTNSDKLLDLREVKPKCLLKLSVFSLIMDSRQFGLEDDLGQQEKILESYQRTDRNASDSI